MMPTEAFKIYDCELSPVCLGIDDRCHATTCFGGKSCLLIAGYPGKRRANSVPLADAAGTRKRILFRH